MNLSTAGQKWLMHSRAKVTYAQQGKGTYIDKKNINLYTSRVNEMFSQYGQGFSTYLGSIE